jgi:hypothetical protein
MSENWAGNAFSTKRQLQGESIAAQIINPIGATKLDPNSLEDAAPTLVNGYYRLTVTNETVVGTTMPSALTYSVPLVDILGNAATIGYEDLLKLMLVAGEAPPVDVCIWAGFSEGVVADANRGCAIGLAYEAGNWRLYRAVNVATAWGNRAAATNTNATTLAGALDVQFSASTNSGTQSSKILLGNDGDLAPISGTNFSLSSAMALSNAAFTHVFIGFDWLTGSGGSDGETIDLRAVSTCLDVLDIPGVII